MKTNNTKTQLKGAMPPSKSLSADQRKEQSEWKREQNWHQRLQEHAVTKDSKKFFTVGVPHVKEQFIKIWLISRIYLALL